MLVLIVCLANFARVARLQQLPTALPHAVVVVRRLFKGGHGWVGGGRAAIAEL